MIIGISGKIGSGKDTVGKIIQFLTDDRITQGNWTFDEYCSKQRDVENYPSISNNLWQIKKYAGKLKQIASLITGIPVEDFEKEEIKSSYLGEEWYIQQNLYIDLTGEKIDSSIYPLIPITAREFLQKLGTEAIRNQIHPNAWINALFADYKSTKKEGGFNRVVKNEQGIPIDYRYEIEYPNWIITDVRFPNEADAILERKGVLIRVERPVIIRTDYDGSGTNFKEELFDSNNKSHVYLEAGHNQMHPSETSLDDYKGFKYLIKNDSDIETLIKNVRQILYSEEILKV